MLTELKALKETSRFWHGIADRKLMYKPENKYVHNCPCCQYVAEKCGYNPDNPDSVIIKGEDCRKFCPMISLWPRTCEQGGPYLAWSEDDRDPLYANLIAEHADKLIKEIEMEKKSDTERELHVKGAHFKSSVGHIYMLISVGGGFAAVQVVGDNLGYYFNRITPTPRGATAGLTFVKGEMTFEESLPELEVGAKVLVWNSGTLTKSKRYFAHFKDGRTQTFRDGATPWSGKENLVVDWDHYEVVEE